MARDLDRYLPFRENGPSVLAIRRAGGPFSPEHIRTKAGFFSALVFRGVTFSTEFAIQHRTLFHDLNDWNVYIQSVIDNSPSSLPATYFCKKHAYGSTTDRSVDHVQKYWEVAEEHWETMVGLDGKANSFKAFRDEIVKGKNAHGNSLYHAFGPLTGYLLTADYAEAGLIQIPTKEEMGDLIVDIGAGAVSALEEMGLVRKKPS
ncbi:hypothetical protein DENSPDRAFT_789805, partial [Dentipellis sp. KUC8613]